MDGILSRAGALLQTGFRVTCERVPGMTTMFMLAPTPESYFEPLKLYTRLVVNKWSECSAPGAISLL